MRLRKLYDYLAEVLDLDAFSPEKRSSVATSIQQLRHYYRESTFNIDYSHPSIQEAYLVSYYPYYVDQLPKILEELYKQKPKIEWSGDIAQACFLGAGPAPEVVGWIGFINKYYKNINSAKAVVLDKYASAWDTRRNQVTRDGLVPKYWNGELSIDAYDFDFSSSNNWNNITENIRESIQNSSLFVMQNCISDQVKNAESVRENIIHIFNTIPEGSLFVITDFEHTGVEKLMKSIEEVAETFGMGDVLLSVQDGKQSYTTTEIPETIKSLFSDQDGQILRQTTQYYRTVLRKRSSESIHNPRLPNLGATSLPTPNTPELSRITLTLSSVIVPGRKFRLSPYIELAQARLIFNQDISLQSREQSWRRILDSNHDRINRLTRAWQTASSLQKTSTEEEVYAAALIAQMPIRTAQIQYILLDLVRDGYFPSPARFYIKTESIAVDIIAIYDFLTALVDVCDLYKIPYHPNQVIFYLENASLSKHEQNWLESYLQETSRVYSDRLPKPQIQAATQATKIDLCLLDHQEDRLDKRVARDAVNIILAAGDEDSAQSLMEWRKQFIIEHPDFRSIGVCGHELGNQMQACVACAIYRTGILHTNPLIDKFFSHIDQKPILRWSYAVLKGGFSTEPQLHTNNGGIILSEGTTSDWLHMRYIGMFENKQQTIAHPDQPNASQDKVNQVKQTYYKVCPATVNLHPSYAINKAAMDRETGKYIPNLYFGEAIQAFPLEASFLGNNNSALVLKLRQDTQYKRHYQSEDGAFIEIYDNETKDAIDRLGYRLFGFKSMRPFQHEILAQVMTGKSVLGIAATGGGKSECFIMPSLLLQGITIVISPLKSLIQDQIDQRLRDRYGVDFLATFINSDVPLRERQARLMRAEHGYYKIIYTTPEQLERSYMLESLKRANETVGIRYIAMDEAHCISQWGHDFRPSYLNIINRLKTYGITPVRIALTATASPKVREDLCHELEIINAPPSDGGNVLIFSSNRPELNLVVKVFDSTKEKAEAIVDELQRLVDENHKNQAPGAAIVFMPHTGGHLEYTKINENDKQKTEVNTGKQSAGVTRFASYLERTLKQKISIYHGKMDDSTEEKIDPMHKKHGDLSERTRRGEQADFITGKTDIMVATKGFGMGIDKPNIRLVIHRSPTANLESYAQEAGRAGRDGENATAVLLYSPDTPNDENENVTSDYEIQKFFIDNSYITPEHIIPIRKFLLSKIPYLQRRIYFPCFEIIYYLDKIEFSWPDFPKSQLRGNYSEEHRVIAETAHYYKQKRDYIKRILAALYRIRPDVAGYGERLTAIESAQEVSICIQPEEQNKRTINAKQILESNDYFGKRFREINLSVQDLESLLSEKTIEPLAKALGESLYETKALINDIIQADVYYDNNSRRRGAMLDLRFTTPRPFTDEQWREFAGGERDADKNKPKRTLNDWFPPNKYTKPIAWDVDLGSALLDDHIFDAYYNAFREQHEERKRNDWDAYHRLITDYIGVDSNGALNKGTKPKTCLRSIMLGYLKTYEVVSGGNCKSCSVCVKDGDFNRHTKEERQSAVIKMNQHTVEMLDAFEKYANTSPTANQLDHFFNQINVEAKQGISVTAYVQSWSARLLQDTPGHRAALWIRTAGVKYLGFELSTDELTRNAKQLFNKATDADELRRVMTLIEEWVKIYDDPQFKFLAAQCYHAQKQPKVALSLVRPVLNILQDPKLTQSAYKLAYQLTSTESPVANAKLHITYGFWLAQTEDRKERQVIYDDLLNHYPLNTVLDQIPPHQLNEFLLAYFILHQNEDKVQRLETILEKQPRWLLEMDIKDIKSILSAHDILLLFRYDSIRSHLLASLPKLASQSSAYTESLLWALNEGLIEWDSSYSKPIKALINDAQHLTLNWSSVFLEQSILETLITDYEPTTESEGAFASVILASVHNIDDIKLKSRYFTKTLNIRKNVDEIWYALRNSLLENQVTWRAVIAHPSAFINESERWYALQNLADKVGISSEWRNLFVDVSTNILIYYSYDATWIIDLKTSINKYQIGDAVLKNLIESQAPSDLIEDMQLWWKTETNQPIICDEKLIEWLNHAELSVFRPQESLPEQVMRQLAVYYRPNKSAALGQIINAWFSAEVITQDVENALSLYKHVCSILPQNKTPTLITQLREALSKHPKTWHILAMDNLNASPIECLKDIMQYTLIHYNSAEFALERVSELIELIFNQLKPHEYLDAVSYIEQINNHVKLTWVDNFTRMIKLIDIGYRLVKNDPQGGDIVRLYEHFMPSKNPSHAMWLAEILSVISKRANINWLTPRKYLIEAYCYAGMYEEAREVAEEFTEIQIGSKDSEEYVDYMKEKRTCNYIPDVLDEKAKQFVRACFNKTIR